MDVVKDGGRRACVVPASKALRFAVKKGKRDWANITSSWRRPTQMPRLHGLPLASTFFIAKEAPMVCAGALARSHRQTLTAAHTLAHTRTHVLAHAL
eukprot:6194660-Pleurochrysis_carterae.AAC.5